MNNSQVDPLRHLKRLKNRTPSKATSSKQLSQTNIVVNNSGDNSMIGLMESKLEETALLKENCYDANKYYSQGCEEYLRKIGYESKNRSNGSSGRNKI